MMHGVERLILWILWGRNWNILVAERHYMKYTGFGQQYLELQFIFSSTMLHLGWSGIAYRISNQNHERDVLIRKLSSPPTRNFSVTQRYALNRVTRENTVIPPCGGSQWKLLSQRIFYTVPRQSQLPSKMLYWPRDYLSSSSGHAVSY